ncbi:ATP-binding protein [Undibacterium sp. TJN19]|uniref:hybrid sensor histidine kinase/response regulator n=1 Tax=Undibacterium sp. TJN19 TaxID=3413055 RepID=UPI003BF0FEBC
MPKNSALSSQSHPAGQPVQPVEAGLIPGFASAGGKMGAQFRQTDWANTPLGAMSEWPQSLRTAVGIMLNSGHPMYVAWGPQLCFLYNDGYEQILGAKADHPELILGKPFHVVWADVWNEVKPMLDLALDGTSTWQQDYPFILNRNGYEEKTYVTFSCSPIHDESGKVAGVFCACMETTGKVIASQQRDHALKELTTSAEKLELATDLAELGLFDHDLLTDEVIWNAHTRRHFGLAAGAQVSPAMFPLAFHPDDHDRVLAETAAFFAASKEERYEVEYRTIGLDDGKERWLVARGRLLLDEAGKAARLVGTTMDITARQQVEQRLRLLDKISEVTRVAVDPTVIMMETTRLLGEYLGVTRVAYADLEPDNDCFTIRHDWTVPDAISTVGVYSLDLFGTRAAGNLRKGLTLQIFNVDQELAEQDGAAMFRQIGIQAIICCPLVKAGRLAAMMAVHQDRPRIWSADEVILVEAVVERCWAHIERVRAIDALREADRRKTEFLAMLAHELRNPLAPVRNGLEVLKLRADNPAMMSRIHAMMERQIGHMVHLIDDLLDIARIASGKVVLKKQHVELQQIITAAIETSMPLIEAAQHVLTVDMADGPFMLDADPVRMGQVISNLLSNAAKYTPARGEIRLSVSRHEEGVLLSVTDNGMGIPAESLPLIFEMFAQVGRNMDRAKGGLGIGLSLVRRLLDMHGGTVTACSEGAGKGSTFTVRLPLLVTTDTERQADAGGSMHQQPGRLRVLVVDDNVDAAESLSDLLEISGHQTAVAHHGDAALKLVTEFSPQVIFLDIGLPGLNGYELASIIRAMPAMQAATLVALTGWGTEDDRARSKAASFDYHLVKPATLEHIIAVLPKQ